MSPSEKIGKIGTTIHYKWPVSVPPLLQVLVFKSLWGRSKHFWRLWYSIDFLTSWTCRVRLGPSGVFVWPFLFPCLDKRWPSFVGCNPICRRRRRRLRQTGAPPLPAKCSSGSYTGHASESASLLRAFEDENLKENIISRSENWNGKRYTKVIFCYFSR